MPDSFSQPVREQILFILFTDIYRSSHLWEAYPRDYPARLERHNALIEAAVLRNGGWVLKGMGDGYIALFGSPLECAACAVDVQREAAAIDPLPGGEQLTLRVVAHGGSLRKVGDDYFGPALNRAARMCQVCHPGQLLISGTVKQLLPHALPSAQVIDLGEHQLRDLSDPERLYQVDCGDFPVHEFPPLPTLANRPTNLSVQPNVFIGREAELHELSRLLLDPGQRLVTIVAPGGYGKSRIAAQLCAELLDEFEHGVYEVLLAPLSSPARIISAAADALRFPLYSGRDAKEQLLDFLRDRQLLIHFDNFEHLMAGAQMVNVMLQAAPRLKVLVTSREPLRLRSEQVYHLPPLSVDPPADAAVIVLPAADCPEVAAPEQLGPAVRLFVDRAQLVRHDFNLDARELQLVRSICERLGGVPLAIELAAAWVDSFTPAELLAEVESQLELTARMGDVPERHRSVRASLDWSWKLLTDEQRQLLRGVAAFNGGFHADMAVQLTGLKGVRRPLIELVDKSWLTAREVHGRMRFFLRDAAAREYAISRLKELPEWDSVALGHAALFSALMAQWGPQLYAAGQLEAIAALDAERENLYEALDSSINRCRGDLVLPFAQHMSKYLDMLGRNQEAEAWFTRMLQCSDHCGNLQQRLAALLGDARVLWGLGRFDDAERRSREAVNLALELEDNHARAVALANLGNVAWSRGQYGPAEEFYRQSLEIGRQTGELWATASALDSLGILAGSQGRYEEALTLFRESLELSRQLGDRRGIAYSLSHLGYTAFYLGRHEVAQRLGEETLAIRRELRDVRGVAYSLIALGEIHGARDEQDVAIELYTEAREKFREIADRRGYAHCIYRLGAAALNQERFEDAVGLLEQSLNLERELGMRQGVADSLRALAAAHDRLGRLHIARPLLVEALQIARELGNPSMTAEVLVTSGMVLLESGSVADGTLLLHGADARMAALGTALPGPFVRRREEGLRIAGERLGEDELAALKLRGAECSEEELIGTAIAGLTSVATPKEVGSGAPAH
jgi:predicted ATPase/class 3 adenylate cyclase